MRLLKRWRDVSGAVLWAFGRFPVAIVALAAFAIIVNLDIAEIARISGDDLARAGFALVGAAAIAASMALLGERMAIAALVRHVLSLGLAAIVGATLWSWETLAVSFPALFLAAVLTVPLAPYLRRELAGFWAFIWRLTHALALAFIAIVVFCLGLSAIFATIEYLFGVDVRSSLYGHIWAIGLGFVGPLFALSLIPTVFPEADTPDGGDVFVAGIRILADFVAVPLLAAYVVILHVYAVKIAVETELPKGQIGWMVLTFGVSVLALRIIVHPLSALGRMPTKLFLRYWAPGLVVPLVLLVIAVWQRIDAYGVTPERYGLVLFALFLALVLLVQLPPRLRGDIRFIPAIGALALLVASIGPWGIVPVSARSQFDRLMVMLTDTGVLEDGRIVGAPQFSRGAAQDVRSIVRMLVEIKATGRLAPLFSGRPDDPFLVASDSNNWTEATRLWAAFNVKELPSEEGQFAISAGWGTVAISGYDLVAPDISLKGFRAASFSIGDGLADVRLGPEGVLLEIKSGDVTVQVTPDLLRDAIEKRVETVEKPAAGEARPPFLVELSIAGKRIGLLFEHVSGELKDGALTLSSAGFDLLLRSEDWPRPSGGPPLRGADP